MDLKQAILNNTGMQQDLSISKGNNDFAYKNLNIRIQSTNDSTLASITNIKSPKRVITQDKMRGKVLNSILCNEYIVVFTHSETTDYIYRIDLNNVDSLDSHSLDSHIIRTLFEGNLNFSYDNPIDSVFFFENNNVQKVYWVDGWRNLPRVINIITEGERNGTGFNSYDSNTVFDFYPELKGSIPEITAVKNFEVESEIPAGVVQYFVSYYNNNSSESLIAASSFLYNVDLKDRGANADSKGCAFYVTISNVENVNYEYLRLYAVRRTSLDGECITTIVKDFKIASDIHVYTALDQGIGQETLDASQIFFIGGSPIFAKTLCYKDNTLFMGGIRTKGVVIDDDIKEAIDGTIRRTWDHEDLSFAEALILKEDYKTISPNTVNIGNYYPYKLQKDLESIDYKTYKVGEVYRFGIQFQGKYGQWSEVVWIGDKKIQNLPTYNDDSNTFNVSNISFGNSGSAVENAYKEIFSQLRDKGFVNYRLLIADPETTNGRSILAQGVVCPTMFTPKLRSENAPHTINSWIMRPRNGTAANHHLEVIHSANQPGGELSTYDARYKIGKYVYVGLTDTIHVGELDIHNLPFEFKRSSDRPNYSNASNAFFIDESILGLYSPELTSDSVLSQQPKFRIIGYTPLTVNYSDADLTTQNIGISLSYTPSIVNEAVAEYRVGFDSDTGIINPLYSGEIYRGPAWQEKLGDWTTTIEAWDTDLYTIHMWQHSKSVIGFDNAVDKVRYISGGDEEELSQEPLVLKNSYFYNHLFSTNNVYLPNSIDYNVKFGVKLCKEDSESFDNNFNKIYYKSFDYVSTNEYARIYSEKIKRNNSWKSFKESSRITFNGIPHAVFYLGEDNNNHLEILPNFRNEYPYNGIFTGKYSRDSNDTKWKDISDEQYNPNNILSILNKIFTNKINSVGTTIGAGWIDDFVKYTDATVKDVYDADSTHRYKTLCAVPRDAFPESASDDPDDFPLHVYPPDEDVIPDPGFGPPYKNPLIPNWLEDYDYTDDNSLPDGNGPDGEPWQGRDWKIIILYASTENKAYKVAFRLLNNDSQIQLVKLPLDDTTGTGDLTQAYPYITESNHRVWKEGVAPEQGGYDFITIGNGGGTGSTIVQESSLKKADTSNTYRYTQRHIDIEKPSIPYLFMGELYYDIEYKYLYGGYSKDSIDKLNWIPISKAVKIPEASDNFYTIEKTEGDTYYQRWDCLKTFPKTTEDMNNVVDITSFMVETHINLDERTDVNRGNFNMFVRPETFNLFNPVYSQKNNLFSYSTINSLFSEVNENQVIWSQAKNFLGNVDTWTGINAVNFTNLKYPVTKLVNFNNKVLGLTEKSVEIINFNAKNMITTTENTAIELKNSAKVDGTIDFSVGKGSTNPSVLVTEKGFYFIEDNENSLIRIEYDGSIKNIALGKMDSWFKNNIVPGNHLANPNAFVLSYDAKNKDVYIANNSDVLVYNETMENFTSFVDFQELLSLYTHKGNVFALAHTYENNVERTDLFKLYGGDTYGYGFYRKPLPYSIQYRVNPGPYTDKVFTNIELKADLWDTSTNSTSNVKPNSSTSNVKPFDTIQVWNEYQDTGAQPLLYDRLSSLRDKFRTWRAIIPRNKKGDKSTWRDRIRNPWVHLKLDNTNVNGQKLEFHNIAVTYME